MKFPSLSSLTKRVRTSGSAKLDPARDWLILLALFLLAFVGSIVWNAWFFRAVVAEEALIAPPEEAAPADDPYLRMRAIYDIRASTTP